MSILLAGVALVAALALLIILPGLKLGPPTLLAHVRPVRVSLLVFAGVCSGLLALVCLAAAAWGMNTRLPWGLGVLMYLTPALSLPAFAILAVGPVRVLSYVLWFLTGASSFAFYFGDKADRLASGLKPLADPGQRIGMFCNAFTLVLVGVAVLVQTASVCASFEERTRQGSS